MKTTVKIIIASLATLGAIAALLWFLTTVNIPVLEPKGMIAHKERDLLIISSLLMLIVVIPVLVLTAYISWKYGRNHPKARYTPDWGHSVFAESLWWGIPLIIIVVLAIITWRTSHDLNPFKPIDSNKKALKIQVVALQWKWLFIYPEEGIASLNFVQFPKDTPLNFEITADAPMNSFWIPQLGGQIYAMPAMRTKLHLIAQEEGEYIGKSSNLSGKGFAGMNFVAKATSEEEFQSWVSEVKGSDKSLGMSEYSMLVEPSEYVPPTLYRLEDMQLFDSILMKYTTPPKQP